MVMVALDRARRRPIDERSAGSADPVAGAQVAAADAVGEPARGLDGTTEHRAALVVVC